MTQRETELYEIFISKQRKQSAFDDFSVKNVRVNPQAPDGQKWDSAIRSDITVNISMRWQNEDSDKEATL